MKLLGVFQILIGVFVFWLGLDAGGHGAHLPVRVEATVAPIVSEALRTTPDDVTRAKKEKEFQGVIGAIYVFVTEANGRLFHLGVDLLATGILQIGFGAYVLFVGKKGPTRRQSQRADRSRRLLSKAHRNETSD